MIAGDTSARQGITRKGDREILSEEPAPVYDAPMYIGVGTLVVILIIVLIIYVVRRA